MNKRPSKAQKLSLLLQCYWDKKEKKKK